MEEHAISKNKQKHNSLHSGSRVLSQGDYWIEVYIYILNKDAGYYVLLAFILTVNANKFAQFLNSEKKYKYDFALDRVLHAGNHIVRFLKKIV